MSYDSNNIFARILRGEIPCRKVDEDAHTLSFHDINPLAPTHVLVVPKGEYRDVTDFADRASDAEIAALFRAAARVAKTQGVEGAGYRVLANCGGDAHQEVPHLHLHVFGGRPLGAMLKRSK